MYVGQLPLTHTVISVPLQPWKGQHARRGQGQEENEPTAREKIPRRGDTRGRTRVMIVGVKNRHQEQIFGITDILSSGKKRRTRGDTTRRPPVAMHHSLFVHARRKHFKHLCVCVCVLIYIFLCSNVRAHFRIGQLDVLVDRRTVLVDVDVQDALREKPGGRAHFRAAAGHNLFEHV